MREAKRIAKDSPVDIQQNTAEKLANGEKLPDENYDHPLGNWAGQRECHIEPDRLLVYFCEK